MMKQIISTDQAPAAIGPYSQAVKAGNTVYLSGQIGMDPSTMQVVSGGVSAEAEQMFKNLVATAQAAGGTLASVVRMTIYLTDMTHFAEVNRMMERFFEAPFPARACIAVKELPKKALVEADAIMVLGE
ncbi:MAG: reactive intermediate/imine deaminase [Coxiella sp. RIFCSPHIGHO2_12_FULL_42_15]|nr:MAG: reactive intermediate/imine deaminase [Coxiella sp. RIFCSPHIGHO2_12_FULL_42_15]